jgi:hypothetical protein
VLNRQTDAELDRQRRAGATASLLLIAGLVNAACGTSPTGPTAVVPTVDLSGRYTLTLRTSRSCPTSSDSSQAFSFDATLNQQDSALSLDVQITLGGIRYPVTLRGSVQNNELRFRTADCVSCTCEAFTSDISKDETFGMCGSSAAAITNSRHITGVFSGTFVYYRIDSTGQIASSSTCSAADHAFTLDAI